ncbi:30S ribosomal protein S20 [Gloeomargaritaceae cyanobacterium AH-226-B11]|jgi:small subunit ribosomal protein S20|nr:30S ribosomal protein S20 [Gloeomargaritaceae cyanobacterium AH-226-B11]
MANNKSALKRIKINERNRLQNRYYKSGTRTLIKRFSEQLETYKISQEQSDKHKAQTLLNLIYSLLDKGTKKNIYHKNTAARKKAQLAAQLKNI